MSLYPLAKDFTALRSKADWHLHWQSCGNQACYCRLPNLLSFCLFANSHGQIAERNPGGTLGKRRSVKPMSSTTWGSCVLCSPPPSIELQKDAPQQEVLCSEFHWFKIWIPSTSYRLYQTLCIPILLYGAEIWTPSKFELNMLERVQRNILRTVLSRVSLHIPTHRSLTTCLGVATLNQWFFSAGWTSLIPSSVLIITHCQKSFSIQDPLVKGLIPDLQTMLDHLNLPSINILLDNPIKPASWKRSIKTQLGVRAHLKFLEDCQERFLSKCDTKIGWPLPHWSVTVCDGQHTRATNFRICLLAGCDGLEKDVARFQSRNNGIFSADPSCKLCGDPTKDTSHFISCCPALKRERVCLISSAPTSVQALLPDHVTSGKEFSDVILGIDWVSDRKTQLFCIDFLSSLRWYRISKLTAGHEATLP